MGKGKEERKERKGRERKKEGEKKEGVEKKGRGKRKRTNVGERQGRTALDDYSKITWRGPTLTMTALKNWRIMTLGIII